MGSNPTPTTTLWPTRCKGCGSEKVVLSIHYKGRYPAGYCKGCRPTIEFGAPAYPLF